MEKNCGNCESNPAQWTCTEQKTKEMKGRNCPQWSPDVRTSEKLGNEEFSVILQQRDQVIKELQSENERLNDWKRIIENAPGKSKDTAIERFNFTQSIQPIISVWKSKVDERDQVIKELVEALEGGAKFVNWFEVIKPNQGANLVCNKINQALELAKTITKE